MTDVPISPTNPAHYREHPSGVECIQVTEHMGFCVGNAIKYLWRADLKDDAITDLERRPGGTSTGRSRADGVCPMPEYFPRTCPACGHDVRVYYPKNDPNVLMYVRHYLNPTAWTTPDDRGDRCLNSGWPVGAEHWRIGNTYTFKGDPNTAAKIADAAP